MASIGAVHRVVVESPSNAPEQPQQVLARIAGSPGKIRNFEQQDYTDAQRAAVSLIRNAKTPQQWEQAGKLIDSVAHQALNMQPGRGDNVELALAVRWAVLDRLDQPGLGQADRDGLNKIYNSVSDLDPRVPTDDRKLQLFQEMVDGRLSPNADGTLKYTPSTVGTKYDFTWIRNQGYAIDEGKYLFGGVLPKTKPAWGSAPATAMKPWGS